MGKTLRRKIIADTPSNLRHDCMSRASPQLPLFDHEESAAISPVRASNARKAIFANLRTLKHAAPAAVIAPQFAEWEAGFLRLCDLLPVGEADDARAALAGEIARLKALAPS
mgnify:CR=1 FL=1